MHQLGCWPSTQLYFPGTTASNSENLAFHGDKMGGKDHGSNTHTRARAHAHTHTDVCTCRLYVCKLGWMCNLTHTHTCSQVSVHASTQGIYSVRLATQSALSFNSTKAWTAYSHNNQ